MSEKSKPSTPSDQGTSAQTTEEDRRLAAEAGEVPPPTQEGSQSGSWADEVEEAERLVATKEGGEGDSNSSSDEDDDDEEQPLKTVVKPPSTPAKPVQKPIDSDAYETQRRIARESLERAKEAEEGRKDAERRFNNLKIAYNQREDERDRERQQEYERRAKEAEAMQFRQDNELNESELGFEQLRGGGNGGNTNAANSKKPVSNAQRMLTKARNQVLTVLTETTFDLAELRAKVKTMTTAEKRYDEAFADWQEELDDVDDAAEGVYMEMKTQTGVVLEKAQAIFDDEEQRRKLVS